MLLGIKEISKISGVGYVHLSMIMAGTKPMTKPVAHRLSKIAGKGFDYWYKAKPEQVKELLEVDFWMKKGFIG